MDDASDTDLLSFDFDSMDLSGPAHAKSEHNFAADAFERIVAKATARQAKAEARAAVNPDPEVAIEEYKGGEAHVYVAVHATKIVRGLPVDAVTWTRLSRRMMRAGSDELRHFLRQIAPANVGREIAICPVRPDLSDTQLECAVRRAIGAHPVATDDVRRAVRSLGNISKGRVYGALCRLVRAGLVAKGDGVASALWRLPAKAVA